MDEQWAIVITYSDGKTATTVDSSLRFPEQRLAARAMNKITETATEKGVKGLTVLGPFQIS
jgi:hypothetical protein